MQASQDIAESASGSINLSAQKNIVGHAQDKISLFAAQRVSVLMQQKGKLGTTSTQDDAIEAIAKRSLSSFLRKKIELYEPKRNCFNSGWISARTNADGVFSTTGGKFESKSWAFII